MRKQSFSLSQIALSVRSNVPGLAFYANWKGFLGERTLC
jgi:hypothetical protein